jgi:hypothetical protein
MSMHVTIEVARAYMRDMQREAELARGSHRLPTTARLRAYVMHRRSR